MITEDYVSFEVAKLLKEKGFDIPCHYTYHGDITSVPFFHRKVKNFNGEEYSGKTTEWVSCPTHQMAMKWLREEKHIIFVFKPATFSGEECTYWTYEIWAGDNFEGEVMSFKTYEEAVEAALKYSLENLI